MIAYAIVATISLTLVAHDVLQYERHSHVFQQWSAEAESVEMILERVLHRIHHHFVCTGRVTPRGEVVCIQLLVSIHHDVPHQHWVYTKQGSSLHQLQGQAVLQQDIVAGGGAR